MIHRLIVYILPRDCGAFFIAIKKGAIAPQLFTLCRLRLVH
jgi:hypothetical protein